MQLESLKTFCDVVRQRSFSQAAREGGITQSAVSQIVSQLEKRMNVQLIDRSTRPLRLTPLGLSYYEGVKALLEQYDELEASIRHARSEIVGNVTVAAIYSVGLSDMGQFVRRFQSALPRAQVHIDYLHPDRVYERVQDGSADLGLVSFPKKTSSLAAIAWRDEEMVLACAPKHPLASRLAVAPRELNDLAYVHFDKDLVVRRRVDRFLREHQVSVDVVAQFDSIENIKQAVAIGAGVALLPEPTLRGEVKSHTLVALPLFGCHFTRPLAIIHRRGHRLSAAAKRFMDLLLEPEVVSSQSNGQDASRPSPVAHPKAPARGANGSAARSIQG
ncbi:MAG: LysR family transcriptional regulator [Planctomycetes bacterium]|nr:LysR family transcriptional regulator [Planctomycetota bacterium]